MQETSIKVSLKIDVLWILLTSKILYQNISKFVRKYRRRCSVKKVFSEILQDSQEICEISKNTFSYRTPLVPASKNTYNKCGAGLQPGTYFTRSFIFQDFFYTLGKPIFRNTEKVCYSFFYCNVSSKNLLSLFLCFKKSDALYLFSTNWLLLLLTDKFTITEFAIIIRNLSFLVFHCKKVICKEKFS